MARKRREFTKVPEIEIPPAVWSISKRRAREAIRALTFTPEMPFEDFIAAVYCQGITDMGVALNRVPQKCPAIVPDFEVM